MTVESMPRVFFDGACPLCTREIAFYRTQKGASGIAWVDVSQTAAAELPRGLSRHDALARFHVQTGDGGLVEGAAAFSHLWSALPRFHLLGKFARTSPVLWILERLYSLFLSLRPYLQRWIARRDRAKEISLIPAERNYVTATEPNDRKQL
jgi:predicted DCC family thiol-disulfide oxidoreductase YuxK